MKFKFRKIFNRIEELKSSNLKDMDQMELKEFVMCMYAIIGYIDRLVSKELEKELSSSKKIGKLQVDKKNLLDSINEFEKYLKKGAMSYDFYKIKT